MPIPQSIQQRGFRKWYERELLVGHSHLVLLVLCVLALVGAMEVLWRQPEGERLTMVVSVIVSAVLGVWAMRRYLFLLMRAEMIANQAVCARCQAYGRWGVEDQTPGDTAAGRPPMMRVCCRGCGERWLIEW